MSSKLYQRLICIGFIFVLTAEINQALAQEAGSFINQRYLYRLHNDSTYIRSKRKIIAEFQHARPGRWGEFVPGVRENIKTTQKYIAFTFDACGGEKGSGFDKDLINFLEKEQIPATLFITGKWIDAHFADFKNLSSDTLFEIENHGLNHKPCSINGRSQYGIQGTQSVSEAFDEIEANARKIEAITGHRPRYYRSATAFIDEASVRMAQKLGITPISFQVLSGDAVPHTPTSVIENNVLRTVKPGALIIMHLNHPEWNTCEAMQNLVPKLRKMGYHFVRLNGFELQSYL